jgi:hypothetical protein
MFFRSDEDFVGGRHSGGGDGNVQKGEEGFGGKHGRTKCDDGTLLRDFSISVQLRDLLE